MGNSKNPAARGRAHVDSDLIPIPTPETPRKKRRRGVRKVISDDEDNAEEGDLTTLRQIPTSSPPAFPSPGPIQPTTPTKNWRFFLSTPGQSVSNPGSTHTVVPSVNEPPWTEKHTPKIMDDLAVHKAKVAEVFEAVMNLRDSTPDSPQILVLSGPAGTGKTRILMMDVVEWSNPSFTTPFSRVHRQEYGPGWARSFQDFLLRGSRLPSLHLVPTSSLAPRKAISGGKLLLVEDLPSLTTATSRRAFHTSISSYLYSAASSFPGSHNPCYPLVLVVTDSTQSSGPLSASSLAEEESKNMSSMHLHQIIPLDILSHPSCKHVRFNPVAPGLMSRALKYISEAENLSLPSCAITSIVSSSSGDLRAAINTLQFDSVGYSEEKKGKKGHGFRSTAVAFSSSLSSSSVHFHHALGRVFYKKSGTTQETLARSTKSILENLSEVVDASDDLSLADNAIPDWKHHATMSPYMAWSAVGGMWLMSGRDRLSDQRTVLWIAPGGLRPNVGKGWPGMTYLWRTESGFDRFMHQGPERWSQEGPEPGLPSSTIGTSTTKTPLPFILMWH
ncbi:Rad17 cell cycle checkpoint protein-domain-containing protein [Piptocephalis cylindrospora]|uniref:Rad17 cell cycle checkpoint protein-domain-containing protein n=1 Tax=Piptocephalis cylindrospora TaxID=1907219 RepID=A0A4P9Y8I0_9FUNG|nr:Rad17 cell cycle checkpoint protein-domain-containing protein [Piptocephalis cylindrospora]|eukprot:RKP14651.1 Rad17 cell cycle checkpoint protein-domain-containing protein [Piptocephalis cylindrospora]